ncbi:MAG: holo-ACP synthase [Betaproteobacteria bacterium]|nr:holo-ACP synthase [Betaproteobacteria bacterium]
MIQGVGIDIVEIERVAKMWKSYGMRFARRILAQHECEELSDLPRPEALLAKRFAVKEAFGKAMGTGLRHPVTWTRIGLVHDALGRPQLRLHPEISQLLSRRGIHHHHVSITDERHFASAVVILES